MRRALLVVAVFSPVIAAGQVNATPGQLLDFNNFSANQNYLSSFVNQAMCDGTATLQLEWQLNQNPTQTGTYTLYASSATPTAPSTGGLTVCATQPDPNTTPPTHAGQIGNGTQINRVQRNTSINGIDAVAPTGFTCGTANENQAFYICAHFTVGSTLTDSAIGKFVIQVAKPEPPTGVSAAPGPGLLTVSWTPATAGTGTVAADHYQARAQPVTRNADGTFTPAGDPVFSAIATGKSIDIKDLTNNQLYLVGVTAFSIGGNESALIAAADAVAPVPAVGFWDGYTAAGGREAGGCASGAAGPVALLAVAGLLGALRRRK